MLSLKAKGTTKSVVVAIIASLLCMVSLLLSRYLCLKAVSFAIDKTSIIDYRVRILAIILDPGWTCFIVSGILTGAFIGFVSKNNLKLTTIFTLLSITILCIMAVLVVINWYAKSYLLIRLYFTCLHLILIGGSVILGVWFVSRRKRKAGQQLLPGDEPKAVSQQ